MRFQQIFNDFQDDFLMLFWYFYNWKSNAKSETRFFQNLDFEATLWCFLRFFQNRSVVVHTRRGAKIWKNDAQIHAKFCIRFGLDFLSILGPFLSYFFTILRYKIELEKKSEKEGCDPSLGGWRGGQWEPFWWVAAGKQRAGAARPRLRGRRADCLRFANPAGALGGLEAWRFGGLERFGKAWKDL